MTAPARAPCGPLRAAGQMLRGYRVRLAATRIDSSSASVSSTGARGAGWCMSSAPSVIRLPSARRSENSRPCLWARPAHSARRSQRAVRADISRENSCSGRIAHHMAAGQGACRAELRPFQGFCSALKAIARQTRPHTSIVARQAPIRASGARLQRPDVAQVSRPYRGPAGTEAGRPAARTEGSAETPAAIHRSSTWPSARTARRPPTPWEQGPAPSSAMSASPG